MLAPVATVPEEDSRTQQTAVYKRAAILLVLCVVLAVMASSGGSILVTGVLIALVGLVTFHALRRTMRNAHSCAL
jgi:hypothetical protein